MIDDPFVYIDANAFINALEGPEEKALRLQSLFESLRGLPGAAATSELTLAEVLAPSSDGRKRLPALQREYLDLIDWSGFIRLIPVSQKVLLDTVNLRATRSTARLRLPDAIQIATALHFGCRFFLSDDKGMRRRLPEGLSRVTSEPSSLVKLVAALEASA